MKPKRKDKAVSYRMKRTMRRIRITNKKERKKCGRGK